MSLSAQERKTYWKDHKDGLNRIRSQLDDRDSPVRRGSPAKSPGYGGRRSHSPLGKYRKSSSPAYLPRIDTPPETDPPRGTKLRGSKYDIVPPVTRYSHQATPDYDSWGEESGDDDEDDSDDDARPYQMPQQYPYPAYGYPAYQPPNNVQPQQVVYGYPFPVYYPPPPPPQYYGKKGKNKKGKQPADRMEVHRSKTETGRKSKKPRNVAFAEPNGFPKEGSYVFNPARNDILQKYKYIYPRSSVSPYTPMPNQDYVSQRYRNDLNSEMYFHFKDHHLFAEGFADWFISDCLEELIPDMLIDILKDHDKLPSDHPYYRVSKRINDELISEVIPVLTREAVRGALSEMVNDYMGYSNDDDRTNDDPLEVFLTRLIDDAVQDTVDDVVRDTVKELASDHMRAESAAIVVEELVEDHVDEIQDELINDIIQDLVIENYIEDEVIYPEVEDEAPEIAREVLNLYDTKIERRELKAVSKQAGDKLLDAICGEYLLKLISRQGKVWTQNDHANKYLDDMIVNILIGEFYLVNKNLDKTITNKPLQKLHEKAVTDVALDMLLQQLSASLDEDLADVDEYERGVDNLTNETPHQIQFKAKR